MKENKKNELDEYNKLKKLEYSAKLLRTNHTKKTRNKISATSFANSFGFQTYLVKFSKREDINNTEAILGYNYPDFMEKGDKKVIYLNSDKKSSSNRRYVITYQIVNFLLNSKEKNKMFLNTLTTFDLDNPKNLNTPISYIARAILLPLDEIYNLYNELTKKYSKKNNKDIFLEEKVVYSIARRYDVPIEIVKRRIKDIKRCSTLAKLNEISYDAKKEIQKIENEVSENYNKERELPSKKRSLIRRLGLNGYVGKYLKKKSN